jgi:4a-hydroxytetrahydrobiopterin dehydratase
MNWRQEQEDKIYSDTEIAAYLQTTLPHWYLENGWIRRKYKTSGWKGTLMVVNTDDTLS